MVSTKKTTSAKQQSVLKKTSQGKMGVAPKTVSNVPSSSIGKKGEQY